MESEATGSTGMLPGHDDLGRRRSTRPRWRTRHGRSLFSRRTGWGPVPPACRPARNNAKPQLSPKRPRPVSLGSDTLDDTEELEMEAITIKESRVALVTGGSRGIGAATALALAAKGLRI